jgi:periplasmic protein TonB
VITSTAEYRVWTHRRIRRPSIGIAIVASICVHAVAAFVLPGFGARSMPDDPAPSRLQMVVMPAKATPEPVITRPVNAHDHPHPHKTERPIPKAEVPKREQATTLARAPDIDRAPAPTQAVPVVTHAPEPVTPSAMRVEPDPQVEQRSTGAAPASLPSKAPVAAAEPTRESIPPVTLAAVRPSMGEGLEPPHYNVAYLKDPKLDYPPAARRLGLQGTVVVRVQVNAAGMPEALKVAQSSGAELLDETALNAIRGWRFSPARRGTEAVAHWVDVPIRFRLVD